MDFRAAGNTIFDNNEILKDPSNGILKLNSKSSSAYRVRSANRGSDEFIIRVPRNSSVL